MKSLTRTRSVGGSLIITIPSEIVKNEMIFENEVVEVEVKKAKQDFFGTLRGIGPFTRDDKIIGQLE